MRRLRDDSGMALVAAIIVLSILMALGLALVTMADGQLQGPRTERNRESGFNAAESVLDAQIYQLGRSWPTSAAPATAACDPSTPNAGTAATTCPDPASFTSSFTTSDYAQPAGCANKLWTTEVHDDDPALGSTKFYNADLMPSSAAAAYPYDRNNNNAVWVVATAAPGCHKQMVVALATRGLKTVNWPESVITADWFQTGNNGSKVIVNTIGANPDKTAAGVSVRCASRSGSACRQYKPGQVAPDTTSSVATTSPTINGATLDQLKQQAIATNTYRPDCTAPALAGLNPGTVVFVDGGAGCTISVSGNTAGNPVILVIKYGAYSLGGNAKFYGLLYAANSPPTGFAQRTDALVTLSGCAKIQGLVSVDGPGGVNVGSCKSNLVYDPTILSSLVTFDAAVAAKNSFRVLRAR